MVDQYLVRSKGVGSIQRNLYWQELKCASVLVPPRDEQDQIVRYLDWQVSKINHLIHGYQKQINLLDERKTTVINQAVTRGIHADVEMQAVEANWVKEIPAHWQFNKVKQHFEIKKRIAGKEGYDVISITQQGLKVKDIASNEGQMAANYSKYQFVYPGDYAMNHMDLLTGFIGLSDFFGVTSPDYRVSSVLHRLSGSLLFLCLCPDLLREFPKLAEDGSLITIVHKFQFILDDIGEVHKDKNFAILIDEAHSSQNGSLSAKMNMVLSGSVYDDEDDLEDKINTIIEGRKMVKNASYFAFTATPKNKTLEMFGKKKRLPDGTTKPEPHYVYTMKQAIEEGFIMDVLRYFTPVQSYYKLAKTIEDDPQFDKKRAQRLLRYYVESNQYAIHEKANIMVEHFHTEVIAKGKVGGKARAMVITSSIKRAIEYYKAISKLLEERKSPFKAIVAFSGSVEYEGRQVTEADLNGFPSAKIEKTFKGDPYRILIVANKFQTGFDEPLLHTMYVDKLQDPQAVVQKQKETRKPSRPMEDFREHP